MSIYYDVQVLRSKLIAMTRLTQRAVDYSIKAFQLGRPELCRAVQGSRDEMSAIRGWIAHHGRALLAARTPGADIRFVCAALRISSALEIAFDAACSIARHASIRFAEGWTPVSAELQDAGNFVNSLLRLSILSLLKHDVRHAMASLEQGSAGHSFDLAVYLAHHDLAQRVSAHSRFELALVRCLDEIAGQVREIADALLQLDEENEPSEAGDAAATHLAAALVSNTPPPGPALLCKVLGFPGPPSPLKAARSETSDASHPISRSVSEPDHAADAAQTRLMGLQQRVCELLVKNQQLRMALMAERAESQHEQLC